VSGDLSRTEVGEVDRTTGLFEDLLLQVMVPLPIEGGLTYSVPSDLAFPVKGSRVLVPVGSRNMVGMAWGLVRDPPMDRLREVKKVLDQESLFPESLMAFLEWISSYYFYPLGKVIAESLPPGLLSARDSRIERISRASSRKRDARPELVTWESSAPENLTGGQEKALSLISRSISGNSFSTILLHGVTGSGKTEVYIRACMHCLGQGRSALVLVPEIAMTAQTVGLFAARFGPDVTVLHSGLTEAQRLDQWWRIRRGESRMVIGTRSAVFAPLCDPGLIIIDEEHDPSYKQEEKLRYQARDLSVLRGHMCGATVVLGSATPSISSYSNALAGRYSLVAMESRVAERPLPEVLMVDRRTAGKNRGGSDRDGAGWITHDLEDAIRATLEKGEQILLFLNRRGFATHVFCPDCGHVFRCPHCEVSLTWHRSGKGEQGSRHRAPSDGRLKCHYCGMESVALPLCPVCGGQGVKAYGYGTERVVSELEEMFPTVRIARLDRDVVQQRRKMEEIIRDFRRGRLDILVGTQMVSKGHDFPGLTLVGILCADISLSFPEYHAAERTFQLLAQVAGRAGRGERPGRVLIQTWLPGHYALKCAMTHDYRAFYEMEARLRSSLCYPPFGRMINLRFSGLGRGRVEESAAAAAALARILSETSGGRVEVLGPAPAPRAKLRDRWRWQVLLKSDSLKALRELCSGVISRRPGLLRPGVRLEIDVDPSSLL
jgi:primosomal protein N' (replication factor Y)